MRKSFCSDPRGPDRLEREGNCEWKKEREVIEGDGTRKIEKTIGLETF